MRTIARVVRGQAAPWTCASMRVPACNCRYLKVTMRWSFGRRTPRAHGPFAMNISDEIHEAMRDYAAGRL